MRNWKNTLRGIAVGLGVMVGAMAPGQASATMAAVAVTDVNMRAGPSTSYPVVVGLPARAALKVYGCTANTTWCDVSWGHERGWVAASYVQVFYRGTPAVVTPAVAPAVGITVVSFNQTYWNTYYVGRPWHGQWNAYHRPIGGPSGGGAVVGCNDHACGAAVVRPGHAAFGHCANGVCSGTTINRGPLGGVRIRHGSISRD